MRRTVSTGELHVSLATAASVAYQDVMGEPLAPAWTVDRWNETLHGVARALANVCPIYSTSDDGHLSQLPMTMLLDGKFDHGGAIARSPNGTVFRRLTIRRDDLHHAVAIFKRIGLKFASRSRVEG